MDSVIPTQSPSSSPAPRPDAELVLPVRMCNELVYCPRLFHIEHVQGIFVASADTVAGAGEHERAARRSAVRKRTTAPAVPGADPWAGGR